MQIADPMASSALIESSCCGTHPAAATGPPGTETAGDGAPDFAGIFAGVLARFSSVKGLISLAAQPEGQGAALEPGSEEAQDLTGLTPEQMEAIVASMLVQGNAGPITLPPPVPPLTLPSPNPSHKGRGNQGFDLHATRGGEIKDLIFTPSREGSNEMSLPSMEGNNEMSLPSMEGNNEMLFPSMEGNNEMLFPSKGGSSEMPLPATEGSNVMPLPGMVVRNEALQGTGVATLAGLQNVPGAAQSESGQVTLPPSHEDRGQGSAPPLPSNEGRDQGSGIRAQGSTPPLPSNEGRDQGSGIRAQGSAPPLISMEGSKEMALPPTDGKNVAKGEEAGTASAAKKALSVTHEASSKPEAQKPGGPAKDAPAPSGMSTVSGKESPLQSGSHGHSGPEVRAGQPQAMNLNTLELSAKGKEERMDNKAGSDLPVMDALSAKATGASPSTVAQVRTGPVLPAQLSEIAQKVAKLSVAPDEIKVQLSPPELGKLTIRVTSDEGGLRAFFYTSSHEARALLQENLGLLKTVLGNQGIQLDGMQVFVGNHPNHTNDKPLGSWAPPVPALYQREEVQSESSSIPQMERRLSKVDCFV